MFLVEPPKKGAENGREIEFPPRRIVLLGASNLIRGISTVVQTAHLAWGGPLDILAALGHGRSYGMESWFLGRSLPGILSCGLWEDLANRPPAPTAALVTDIGNDIVYGASVERVAGWVEQCLERLAPLCERIIVTALPLASVANLSPWRFLLMRTVFFPRSRLELQTAVARAEQLNEQVIALAARYRARLVKPQPQWYGFDPIHIRRRHWPSAWGEVLSSWGEAPLTLRASRSFRRWLLLRRLRPLRRRLLGIEQHQRQPAGALPDGSMISLY